MSDTVGEFVSVTGASVEVANQLLEASGFSLQTAVELFFADPGAFSGAAGAAGGGGGGGAGMGQFSDMTVAKDDTSPSTVSWEELQVQLVAERRSSSWPPGAPGTWSTPQLAASSEAASRKFIRSRWTNDHENVTLHPRLHASDATEIALFRVDATSRITAWNRALGDLTGLRRAEVVGRTYSELIEPLCLSDAYRATAIARIACACRGDGGDEDGGAGDDDAPYGGPGDDSRNPFNPFSGANVRRREAARRARAVFPLPLPLGAASAKNAPHCWVELLVAAGAELDKLDISLDSSSHSGNPGLRWASAPGWLGGCEFVLRITEPVPSLRELCERATGGALTAEDGSLNERGDAAGAAAEASATAAAEAAGAAGKDTGAVTEPNDTPAAVESGVASHGPLFDATTASAAELAFMREVCDFARRVVKFANIRRRLWPQARQVEPNMSAPQFQCEFRRDRGGDAAAALFERVIATLREEAGDSRDDAGTWALLSVLSMSGGAKRLVTVADKIYCGSGNFRAVSAFKQFWVAHTAELGRAPWRRQSGPEIVPCIDDPCRASLTIRIELPRVPSLWDMDNNRDVAGAEWCVVEVPATLTMWQLHRVVVQAMTAGAVCGGARHGWSFESALEHSELGRPDTDHGEP